MSLRVRLAESMSIPLVRKFVRYASVSAISTVVSLSILGTLVWTGATSAGWANVIATGVATIPSFELNRRWVWRKSGRRSLWAEMGPFFVWTFAELALSTYIVSGAVRWATLARFGVGARTFVAEVANIATFGMLWVLQFVLLDRILFRNVKVAQLDSVDAAEVSSGTGDAEAGDDSDSDDIDSGGGGWSPSPTPAPAGRPAPEPEAAPGYAWNARLRARQALADLRQGFGGFRAGIAMALRRS